MEDYSRQYIGGRWQTGSGGEFGSTDPYQQSVWAELTKASAEDVDSAVEAARAAFADWRKTSGYIRGQLLARVAEMLEANAERLAEIETRDNGKLLRENYGQILFAARICRFFGGMADKLTGETKQLDNYDTIDFTVREPLGVCVLITAWNSPLQLLSNKLAPALAAGNTVVVKPSEYTSASTLEFARLCSEIGFPAGVINVVTGYAETGDALTSHPDIAKVSFTGGVETARKIARNAAQNIVPCTLELGGKSANIVFDDADLDRAIPGASAGIFAAAGQTCVAGSRLFVHENVYDETLRRLIDQAASVRWGNPMSSDTQMGPLAHRDHVEFVMDHIRKAKKEGARLMAGGSAPRDEPQSCFVLPTVFAQVTNDMPLAQDEVFGPVAAVLRFRDVDEVIAEANDSRFGLAAGVWTSNVSKAHYVARELRAGNVWINTYRSSAPQAPFGGFKMSGYGRERGTEAILDYTQVKNTMIDISGSVRDPFLMGR